MIGDDSVRPYPSITFNPSAEKNSAVSFGRAAPPETNILILPPVRSRIFLKTSLSARARFAARIGPTIFPFCSRRKCSMPTFIPQRKIFRFFSGPAITLRSTRFLILSKRIGTEVITEGRTSIRFSDTVSIESAKAIVEPAPKHV
jgi:hypothetical protein